jgi:glyoxylase-like metal-dependent hydrolase (beta-lactamase superfamily II)
MSDELLLKTYLSDYKPIPNSFTDWDPQRRATWPATTATLVLAGDQGVLIDSLMTITEGETLGAWIANVGVRDLSTVYVTHGHADHFFGATAVLKRFPAARLLSRPDVADAAAEQATPAYLHVWNSFFSGQITDRPAVPTPMASTDLLIGEHVLRTIDVGQSDVPTSSVVHIEEIETVLSGDVAYNGMHMWLAGSTSVTRASWLNALDTIEARHPRTIIVGHKDPDAPDDDAMRILDQSRQYLHDFDDVARSCDAPADLIAGMLDRYPTLGNPYTLWVAAHDQPAFSATTK